MFKTVIRRPAPDMFRRVVFLALGVLCLFALSRSIATLNWTLVHQALIDIPAWRWMAAGLATAVSFWAISQYDIVAHRHFQTGYAAGKHHHRARQAGAAAVALGQTLGCGPAVGAAVRFRLLPGLSHREIVKLTGFVTLGFMMCWAWLVLGLALPVLIGMGWLILPLTILFAGLAGAGLLLFPRLRIGTKRLSFPSLPAVTQMAALAILDLGFATLALYLLCRQVLPRRRSRFWPSILWRLASAW